PPPWSIKDWVGWTAVDDYVTRSVAGPVFYPKPLGTGSVQFAIRSTGKGHAQWLLQYVNDKNYLLCDLDDRGFQVTRISDGSREIVTKTKPVSKSDWYTIRIDVAQDRITHKLQKNGTFELLDSFPSGLKEGRFGFLIT